MFSLTCPVQNYAWGRIGEESIIAQLKTVSDPIFRTGATTPYSELWMGTHVTGPAKLMDGSLLLDWLNKNPSAVGQVPPGYPADDLPFLFKILSIRTALSIQSHPDKALATELFATRPDIYKDPNHKPEMAIALTPFEAMCGFRPISEIQRYLHSYPELGDMVGGVDVLDGISDTSSPEEKKAALKDLFRKFMDCSDDIANAQISRTVQRLSSVSPSGSDDEIFVHDLVLRLNKDFPNDRFVYNYISTQFSMWQKLCPDCSHSSL
jgi:mannose-6-phosphate isomerase